MTKLGNVIQSRSDLFRAWGRGEKVALFDRRVRRWIIGLVSAVKMESGYLEGEPPTRFLVDLSTEQGMVREIYWPVSR